jgi:UDP-N-acetyl-D-mannosaminuronic acid dehydrogenase
MAGRRSPHRRWAAAPALSITEGQEPRPPCPARTKTHVQLVAVSSFSRNVCVIGGGGHVGLPLALTFAQTGLRTVIYDTNRAVLDRIASGEMPFLEQGGESLLRRVIEGDRLELRAEPDLIAECEFLVVIIGTPVDEHLNPNLTTIRRVLDECRGYLRDGQVIILRSTVVPGMTEHIQRYVTSLGLAIDQCRILS